MQGEHFLKFQLSSSYGLGDNVLKIVSQRMSQSVSNELIKLDGVGPVDNRPSTH